MKIRCGTDIIEIERIKKSIENLGDKFIDTIFTEKEKVYCESHKNMKYQHYAVRFAAKEAIYKAFSDLENLSWKDVEIIPDSNGKPKVKILKKIDLKLLDIDISLSHCKEYAVAMVITSIE